MYKTLVIIFALAILTSCRSNRTTTAATKSEAHTETSSSTTDKEYVHDSVIVYVGDTVEITRWRTSWRERIVHDTVHEHTTDTIIKTETVEKVVYATQQWGLGTGWTVALTLLAVIAVYMVIKYGLKIL